MAESEQLPENLQKLQSLYRDRFTLTKLDSEGASFSIVFTCPEEELCCAADFTIVHDSDIPESYTCFDEELPGRIPIQDFHHSLSYLEICTSIEKALANIAIIASFQDSSEEEEADQDPLTDLDQAYIEAANAIFNADVMLIATGAGWSADSGLATYPGVAEIPPYQKRNITYYDICQPHWLQHSPGFFYGFWGDCTNVYRETTPHEGYAILKRWKDEIIMGKNEYLERLSTMIDHAKGDDPVTHDPFFSLTSNVDAHWWNPNVGAVFKREEVSEVHGNVEFWQTSDFYKGKNDESNVFRLDPDFRFEVDKETMNADDQEKWPKDPKSGTLARPCILMFNDWDWDDPNDEHKYYSWRESVGKLCKETDYELKVVVIEVGCGLRVPTIRSMAERFRRDMKATLIRINPDEHCFEKKWSRGVPQKLHKVIQIQSTGLASLRKIDEIMSSMDKSS